MAKYKHARTVYEQAQIQFELINNKKGKGAKRYIQKKIDELDKKIAQQEKKLMKAAQRKDLDKN